MAIPKSLTWNLMYVGAIICALICVTEIYGITTTGDTTNEWIVWTCVIIGFSLFGFGFVYESKNREEKTDIDAFKKEGKQNPA